MSASKLTHAAITHDHVAQWSTPYNLTDVTIRLYSLFSTRIPPVGKKKSCTYIRFNYILTWLSYMNRMLTTMYMYRYYIIKILF